MCGICWRLLVCATAATIAARRPTLLLQSDSSVSDKSVEAAPARTRPFYSSGSSQRFTTAAPPYRYEVGFAPLPPALLYVPHAQIVSNTIISPKSVVKSGGIAPSAAAYRRTVLKTVKYRRVVGPPTGPVINRPLPIVAVSNTQQMYWRPDCCPPEPTTTTKQRSVTTRKVQLARTTPTTTTTTVAPTTGEGDSIPSVCQRTVNVLTGGGIHSVIEELFTHSLHMAAASQCAISCSENNCDLAYFTRGKGACQFTAETAPPPTTQRNCTYGLAAQEIPPAFDALVSNILVFCIKCAPGALRRGVSGSGVQQSSVKILQNLRLPSPKEKLQDIPPSSRVEKAIAVSSSSSSNSRRYRPLKQRAWGISRTYRKNPGRHLRRSTGWA